MKSALSTVKTKHQLKINKLRLFFKKNSPKGCKINLSTVESYIGSSMVNLTIYKGKNHFVAVYT